VGFRIGSQAVGPSEIFSDIKTIAYVDGTAIAKKSATTAELLD
jgi:hypothetical protein